MRRQSPDFQIFFWNRSMSNRGCPRTAITFSACDAEKKFSRMSRETAKEVSSISARVWNIVGMMRKGEVLL